MFSKQIFNRKGIAGASFLLLLFTIQFANCRKKEPAHRPPERLVFDSTPVARRLTPLIGEISGIADSKVNPGFLWGEQDSDKPPLLYLINHNGNLKKDLYIKGVINTDWEDMTLSGDRLFIGDIGDNTLQRKSYCFYYFKEPDAAADTVYGVKCLRFTYPDGPHNAEAFLVDAAANAVFIITKNDRPSKMYKVLLPRDGTDEVVVAQPAGALTYSGVVSACQSPDGKEIIVKTYLGLHYYKRQPGQSLPAALAGAYAQLPYLLEPQGEAVCFARDNSGFYALSEKGFADFVMVYFYKRN